MNETPEYRHPMTEPELSPAVTNVIRMELALPEDERRDRQNDIENERHRQVAEKSGMLSPEEQGALDAFRRKKEGFISHRALQYRDIMNVFKTKGGILGKENRGWRAVSRHLLVAELVAGEIARAVSERGEEIDEPAVRMATLFHDLTKRIEYSDEAKAFEQSGQGDRYDYAGRKHDEILQKPSVRAAIEKYYPDADTIERLSQSAGIAVLHRGEPGDHLKTLEEKIIFYVDKILKHSAVVPLPERMADVAKRYSHGKVDEELAYTQKVEAELAAKLGIQPDSMTDFIHTLIINRINQHEDSRS